MGQLITAVTRHRVASNVLMLVFILSGVFASTKLNTRFFPEFETNTVSTTVTLSGAAITEIEESIVVPLENSLRNVSDLKKIYSYSREGSGRVILEFPDGTDMDTAVSDIKAAVERVSLPSAANAPRTVVHVRSESVTDFTIATANRDELRDVARRLESELNAAGIAKVIVAGIPEEEILVLVDQHKLVENGLTIEQVGLALRAQNRDATVGSLTGLGNSRKVRVAAKTSEFHRLYQIPVAGTPGGITTYLRDIATITRVPADNQVEISYNGLPAVQFQIINSGGNDIIATAKELHAWLARIRPTLPDTVTLVFHDEDWRAVESRLNLLLTNGITGLGLVLAMLFLFLSLPVAFWVAAGIPAAMLATLFVFYLAGGSINMISMFALIMAVGIIVDDAIVVGENAQYRLQCGQPPMRAVTSAARGMFVPVLASSFTTIASFLPLFLVGGAIGSIIFDIPLIIVCILLVALLECFLILPGHLYHSFTRRRPAPPGLVRRTLDNGFDRFRTNFFRPLATFAVRHALATVTACFVILALAVGLLANGFVNFRFFPGAERNKLTATVVFTSGTTRTVMESYVNTLLAKLDTITHEDTADGGQLVAHTSALYGKGGRNEDNSNVRATIVVELVDPEQRTISTQEFAAKWRKALGRPPPGLERLTMRGARGGPPGQDIEVELSGTDVSLLKDASLQVQEALSSIAGLSSIGDDTPYGKDQALFELTPLGRSLNLQVEDIASQLRNAIDGYQVQTFTEGVDEVDLKVRYGTQAGDLLRETYIRLPNREFVPLGEIVTWRQERGFDTILHRFGRNAITVTADLDQGATVTTASVIASLQQDLLPRLRESHGLDYGFEGRQSQQGEAAADMKTGLALAVVLIFIILTWVFNSWSLPLVVMVTMPLGVIGALLGHWVMGLTLSILSLFGIFTLMGIIVNNSIVLVRCFQDLGPNQQDATAYNALIVDAACLRLRAVLLTSLTTIGGLLPLMFETSLQAQFLIPMAASIVFGLAFATVLILLFTPATIALHGAIFRHFRRLHAIRLGNLPWTGRRRPAA